MGGSLKSCTTSITHIKGGHGLSNDYLNQHVSVFDYFKNHARNAARHSHHFQFGEPALTRDDHFVHRLRL